MKKFFLHDFQLSKLPLAVRSESPRPLHQEIHTHDFCEISFMRGGSGWTEVNGIRHAIGPGCLCLMQESDTHESYTNPGAVVITVMFKPELLSFDDQNLLKYFPMFGRENAAVDRCYVMPPSEIDGAFRMLDELRRELIVHDTAFEYRSRALLLLFLTLLLRYGQDRGPEQGTKNEQLIVGRIFEYISKHYRENPTVGQIAKAAGVPQSVIGRKFKKLTGGGLADYLIRYRIERACMALAESNESITELAFNLGFPDSAWFSHSFKQRMGITPSEYRKKLLVLKKNHKRLF